MKNFILRSLSCFLFIGMMAACSSESLSEEGINVSESAPERLARNTAWDGIIGVVNEDGSLEITADKNALREDLEAILEKQDNRTSLTTLEIVKKTSTNDALDTAYMLMGSNGSDTSIGIMISRSGATLKLPEGFEQPKTVTCRGCATGCNLEYLNTIDGKRVPYCNVNGCISNCTKLESELK